MMHFNEPGEPNKLFWRMTDFSGAFQLHCICAQPILDHYMAIKLAIYRYIASKSLIRISLGMEKKWAIPCKKGREWIAALLRELQPLV